jgi:hypothetical protein
MILIIGNQGNMGRRYQIILNYLKVPSIGYDQDHKLSSARELIKTAGKIIIATPTDSHLSILKFIGDTRQGQEVDVLCEKPIVKDRSEYTQLWDAVSTRHINLFSVNQYQYLLGRGTGIGDTSWNYFKSGDDGLIWDCFQIIALAKGKLSLGNTSPVWRCTINGLCLNSTHMDDAYVDMIKDFTTIQRNVWGRDKISQAVERCFLLDSKFTPSAKEINWDFSS